MRRRLPILLCAAALLEGCATTSAPPAVDLSPGRAAAEFDARSLRDAGLHRFLAENLGRDPGDTWDFEALTWAAFYFHPSLEVARAQWAGARAAVRGATARPNPTLTLTPGYNFTREAGISPWMPAINFDFLFPTSEKRSLQQSIAQRDAEAARLAVFGAAWQVRSDLRHALADFSLAQRKTAQAHQQEEIQGALLKLLEQRQAAGGVAATEVSTARIARLRARTAAADAHTQALTARAHLASALGLPLAALDGITLPAPPAPAPFSAETLANARREALQSRPDIVIALAKYQSAQDALALEVAKRVPDFHLGPGYQWDQGGNKWSLALSFELPLFHRNEAAIAAATAHRAEVAAQFTQTQAQAIAAIDLAVAAQQAAQLQLAHAHQLRDETQAQQARVQQRLALGGADQVELQTSRLEFANAESGVLDAENAAAAAAGQLEDALQLPFPHLAALAAASHP